MYGLVHWWFWESFWPTLVGAAVGVPAGLWLNRMVLERARRAASQERHIRRREVIGLVIRALDCNIEHFGHIANLVPGELLIGTEIETATWIAVRDDVFELLDRDLKIQLTRHFVAVDRLLAVGYERTTLSITDHGHLALLSESNADKMFLDFLHSQAKKLAEQATALAARLGQLDHTPAADDGRIRQVQLRSPAT